jgi:hypothetical protein
LETEFFHRLIRDPLAGFIAAASQHGINRQSRTRRRSSNIPDRRLEAVQGLARPIQADVAEQAMLDGIPFRTAAWIMADRHLQARFITEVLLELSLPDPRTAAIRAAGIGQDEQPLAFWEALPTFAVPPFGDGLHGKTRGIGAIANSDKAAVAIQSIDPVGDRLANRILWKVMDQYRFRLSTPGAPRVFERANQLLFFVSTLMTGSPEAMNSCLR